MADPVRQLPVDLEPEIPSWRPSEFPYGWRWRYVQLPNGEETAERIPLTADDLLAPQPGDEVSESGPHFKLLTLLADLLTRRYETQEDVLVTGNMQICWGIPGLLDPSPDVAVIRGIREKKRYRSSFSVPEEGVRPCLGIEVASDSDPRVRRNDLDTKVKLYQQAGVPEYFLLDQPFVSEGHLLVLGYEMGPGRRYRTIVPDSQGQLLSRTTGLLFGVTADGRTLEVTDAVTGERLRNSSEEEAGRKAAEERAARAEAEVARLREEVERLRKGSS